MPIESEIINELVEEFITPSAHQDSVPAAVVFPDVEPAVMLITLFTIVNDIEEPIVTICPLGILATVIEDAGKATVDGNILKTAPEANTLPLLKLELTKKFCNNPSLEN